MLAPLLINLEEGLRRGLLPLPETRLPIEVQVQLSPAHLIILRNGVAPGSTDDKWLTFTDGLWTYLYRSWSGTCAYGLRFSEDGSVAEAWRNSDYAQHSEVTSIIALLIHGAYNPDGGGPSDERSIYTSEVRDLRNSQTSPTSSGL